MFYFSDAVVTLKENEERFKSCLKRVRILVCHLLDYIHTLNHLFDFLSWPGFFFFLCRLNWQSLVPVNSQGVGLGVGLMSDPSVCELRQIIVSDFQFEHPYVGKITPVLWRLLP